MVSDRVLAVARGEAEADLLLAGGSVVDVFTGEVRRGEVTVADGIIASVGHGGPARQVIDVAGRTICPGLIDAHVHIESSMVAPYEFARAVVPHGTTTIASSPRAVTRSASGCGAGTATTWCGSRFGSMRGLAG